MSSRFGARTNIATPVSGWGKKPAGGFQRWAISGGTQTTQGVFTVFTFTSPGTLSISGNPAPLACDILLVGGGEPGGPNFLPGYPTLTQPGYGGEGGTVVVTPQATPASLAPGTYPVTVGGIQGTSSIGGTPWSAAGSPGNPFTPATRAFIPGAPAPSVGIPLTTNGGGAGAGGNAPGSPLATAGPGVNNAFRTGSNVEYGRGGTAGIYSPGSGPGSPGPANSGQGGNGANGGPLVPTANTAGAGASGIVVVRVLTALVES